MRMDFGPAVVAAYEARIGECEEPLGSNRGPLPDRCYRYIHNNADPAADTTADREWCAELYCLICHEAGMTDPPRTASTGAIYAWASARSRVIFDPRQPVGPDNNPADIEPGDAGLVLWEASPTGFRHTRCVRFKPSGGWVEGIGGNEDDAVRYSVRPLGSMVYVRPFDAG